MTKFKIGDRVTLGGVVTRINPFYGEFCVRIDGGGYGDTRLTYDQSKLAALSESSGKYTTFRDQAAIAAMQAMLINTDVSPGGDARAMAKSSFELAEALDAERKKRDGGA